MQFQNIERIVIMGDFLRVDRDGRFNQSINIRWLNAILAPLFARLTTLPTTMVEGSHEERGYSREFYRAAAKVPSVRSWVELFDSPCNPRQLALLENWFNKALIIGFEIPEIFIDGFIRLGMPFIDFTIHPVRFMHELLWGVRSNISNLEAIFSPYQVAEDDIWREAELVIAKFSRFPSPEHFGNHKDIALFACQTQIDKVLIANGKLHTLEHFYSRIKQAAGCHELLLIKEHPFEKQPRVFLDYLSKIKNTRFIKANFYKILAQPNLSAVYSIASSCSIEAVYFKKEGRHFIDYPLHFSFDKISSNLFLTINSCLHKSDLWKNLFSILNISINNIKLHDPDLNYRSNLTAWWDAREIYA